jgi:uncharacterized membrane protein
VRQLRDDSGQLLLLVLLYTLVAAGLVVVATDAATVFLHRRALASAADGAALAAMQAADEGAIYTGGAGAVLPVDATAARAMVHGYVVDNRLAARFPDFAVRAVAADGRSVTVTLASRVRLPFVGVLGAQYAAGVPIDATARARAPFVTTP